MTDRGDEVQLVDERARRLLENDQHRLGRTGNLRRSTGTWQTNFGVVIIADHGGVDVAEAVHLRSTEKANIDPAALQPVTKNFTGGYYCVSGFRQLAITIDSGNTVGLAPIGPDS